MTPPVIQRWISIIENGRTDELDAVLADDVVFFSPAVFTPQEGRDKTLMYLTAAVKVFGAGDFHYVEQWYDERSAILEFAATIDGVYVNGIDMIHWNDQEEIVSFKVMLRPLKALQTIIPAMAELLQQLTAGDGPLRPAAPRLRPPQ
jgi:SnoaL-like domain